MNPILYLTPVVLLLFFHGQAYADWYDCESQFNSLKRASGNAAYSASEAQSALDNLENAKQELEDCRDYPESYDYYGDHCQSQKYDYESAKSDYESAVDSVQSDIDTLESKMRRVKSSCVDTELGYSRAVNWCKILISLKGKQPPEKLLNICLIKMTAAQCKICLGLK